MKSFQLNLLFPFFLVATYVQSSDSQGNTPKALNESFCSIGSNGLTNVVWPSTPKKNVDSEGLAITPRVKSPLVEVGSSEEVAIYESAKKERQFYSLTKRDRLDERLQIQSMNHQRKIVEGSTKFGSPSVHDSVKNISQSKLRKQERQAVGCCLVCLLGFVVLADIDTAVAKTAPAKFKMA